VTSAWHDGRPGSFAVAGELVGERAYVVALAGEHDLQSAPVIAEQLRAARESGAPAILVDLAETTFLDSTVIHVLLDARAGLGDGEHIMVTGANPDVARILALTGIDRYFAFFPTRADALASLEQAVPPAAA
jgi:anti-sigma B factor antagonist